MKIKKTEIFLKKFDASIKRKDTSKHKFNADFIFYYDDYGFIYKFKIKEIKEATINSWTTLSWEKMKTPTKWNQRIKLWHLLKISEKINIDKRKIILNKEQLNKLKIYINDETNNINTINAISWLLTGNNPSGGFSSPDRSEFILFESGEKSNITTYVDTILKITKRESKFAVQSEPPSKTIPYTWREYLDNLSKDMKNFFIQGNSAKANIDGLERQAYIKQIKKSFKKVHGGLVKDNMSAKIKKHEAQYMSNIDEKYGKEDWFKVIFKNRSKIDVEKAHIKSKKIIKQEIMDIYKKSYRHSEEISTNKLQEISSFENFLPLTASIHTFHDKLKLYWDKDGLMQFVNNKNNKIISHEQESIYKTIPDKYLTKYRKYFLMQHYEKEIIKRDKQE